MPREPRIHVSGGFYHVILRGNDGQKIFFEDAELVRFSRLLGEGVGRFGHLIHAYCFMPNHVHLVIQVGNTTLSTIVHNFALRYSRWFNWKQSKKGHLFQDRYVAKLVNADEYLLQLVRYVHLNPVRSNLTQNPSEYAWSSHPSYLGKETIPWLTTTWILGMFGKTLGTSRRCYESFVLDGLEEENHPESYYVGSEEGELLEDDSLIEKTEGQLEMTLDKAHNLEDLIQGICRYFKVDLDELKSRNRKPKICRIRSLLALLIQEQPALCLTELGRTLNRDVSTLSSAARRLDDKRKWEEDAAEMVKTGREIIGTIARSQTWYQNQRD